jgi:hypothetical protein
VNRRVLIFPGLKSAFAGATPALPGLRGDELTVSTGVE